MFRARFAKTEYAIVAGLILLNILLLVFQMQSVMERDGLAVSLSAGGLQMVAGDVSIDRVLEYVKAKPIAVHIDPLEAARSPQPSDTRKYKHGGHPADSAAPPNKAKHAAHDPTAREFVMPDEVSNWELRWKHLMKTDPGFKTDVLVDLQPPPEQWPRKTSHVAVLVACSGAKYEQKGSLQGRTIAGHTWRNKQLYAAARGYDAVKVDLSYYKQHSQNPYTNKHRLFVWAKIAVLKGCLDRYRYCFWIDADAVFTNLATTIESFFQAGARESADGQEPGMIIGKTFELDASHDARLPAGRNTYRLNTGIIGMRSTEWSHDFLTRVWDMSGVPEDGRREYIEWHNHEQSTMQYYMLHNPDDEARTYFPPLQAINIHNSFSGQEKWEPGDFLVHYFGGFQGGCHSPHHTEGHNQCIDEFIDRNMEVAAAAPPDIRKRIYPDWATDREVAGRGEFDDLDESECVSPALSYFGLSGDQHAAVSAAVARWPLGPGWARRPLHKKSLGGQGHKFEWAQEVYVRLLRLLFWRYILPVDYSRASSRGSDVLHVTFGGSFVPWVMQQPPAAAVAKRSGGRCLVMGEEAASYTTEGGGLAALCAAQGKTVWVAVSTGKCEADGVADGMVAGGGGGGGAWERRCVDVDDAGQWAERIAAEGGGDGFDVVVSVFDADTHARPWEVAGRVVGAMKEGAVLVWVVPSISPNAGGGSLHRWTVQGAKSMWEEAGLCVARVMPMSNVAVTVGAMLGYAAEDFSTAEHEWTDPVAPLAVGVYGVKCAGAAAEDGGGRPAAAACCRYSGVAIEKAVDCWRGLYGGRDKNGARGWGCDKEAANYRGWSGQPWYELDFGAAGHKRIDGLRHPEPDEQPALPDDRPHCRNPLYRYLGANPRVQREMEAEMAEWPVLPQELSGPLALADGNGGDGGDGDDQGRRVLQELFLRMHRVLYYLNKIPFDLNMGWIRGTPLDRVFLNRVFFPYINQKPEIKGGRCLEWGNTYMAGDLRSICPHQYEIAHDKGPCKGQWGQFDSAVDYQDVRPFHVSGQQDNFKGGYCADIHRSQDVIPAEFFDVVICTFVFEHLHSPWLAAAAMYDMTAPGGYLLWAAPNAEVYHANPGDHWRYTPAGSKALFEEVGYCVIKIMPCSTSAVTSGFFMGFSDNDFEFSEMEKYDPYAPHTVALLAQRPTKDPGFECPPYEGVDLGDGFDCWRGDEGSCRREGGVPDADWDGKAFGSLDRSDGSADVRTSKARPARAHTGPLGPPKGSKAKKARAQAGGRRG